MTKVRIETIGMLPFGMLNAYLLIAGRAAVLVDTGLPSSERLVHDALRRNRLDWSNLKLIVLTHAHIDHAGSAVALRALTSAPIMLHEGDVPYLRGSPPVLRPTGPFGRLFRTTGAIQRRFAYATPDLVVSNDMPDLNDFGLPARLLHTPGHTPGSMSVLLDDGRAIVGDLASSGVLLGGIVFRDRPKQPPFEEAPAAVAASLKQLLLLGFDQFFLGHGGPLRADRIRMHIQNLDAVEPEQRRRS